MWRCQKQLVRNLNLDPRGYHSVTSSRQTLLHYTARKFMKDLDQPGVWHPLKRARSDSGVGIGQDHEHVVNEKLRMHPSYLLAKTEQEQKRQQERDLALANLADQLDQSAKKQKLHH